MVRRHSSKLYTGEVELFDNQSQWIIPKGFFISFHGNCKYSCYNKYMDMLTIFIFILAIGAVWFLHAKISELKKELARTHREFEKEKEIYNGIEEFNKRATELKEQRKQKIMDELKKRGRIQTGQVGDILEISRATSFRYLEELEKEGKITQVGGFGKSVTYRAK